MVSKHRCRASRSSVSCAGRQQGKWSVRASTRVDRPTRPPSSKFLDTSRHDVDNLAPVLSWRDRQPRSSLASSERAVASRGGNMDKVKDFGVPILLLLFGVLGKWLVRRGWSLELSFMGPELVLAGLGSDLAHFLDFGSVFLTRSAVPSQADLRRAGLGL